MKVFIAIYALAGIYKFIECVRFEGRLTVGQVLFYLPVCVLFGGFVLAVDLVVGTPEFLAGLFDVELWKRKP